MSHFIACCCIWYELCETVWMFTSEKLNFFSVITISFRGSELFFELKRSMTQNKKELFLYADHTLRHQCKECHQHLDIFSYAGLPLRQQTQRISTTFRQNISLFDLSNKHLSL